MALIDVIVHPLSQRVQVYIDQSQRIIIKICASPERGKANKEAIQVLAEYLKIAPWRITIVRGMTTRKKVLHIDGFDQESVVHALLSVERNSKK